MPVNAARLPYERFGPAIIASSSLTSSIPVGWLPRLSILSKSLTSHVRPVLFVLHDPRESPETQHVEVRVFPTESFDARVVSVTEQLWQGMRKLRALCGRHQEGAEDQSAAAVRTLALSCWVAKPLVEAGGAAGLMAAW